MDDHEENGSEQSAITLQYPNSMKSLNSRVNSYDVARLAGVSQATVSYVLTRRPGKSIREETRRKVLIAADTLGYQPNRAAKSLATGKTGTIALWVPLIYQNVFNRIAGEIVSLARASDVHVTIIETGLETASSLRKAGQLSAANVDAILAHDATALVNDILDAQFEIPPIISIGPAYSDRSDHVGVDLHGGSLDATRHLFAVGCKSVAFACLRYDFHNDNPRYRGYMQAVRESGAEPIHIPIDCGDYEGGYRGVLQQVSRRDHPDGIFCWNDEVAIGTNRAVSELGLRVPADVAIIGSDGIAETAYCMPTLSTAAQPFVDMCELAWTYVLRRWEVPDLPIQGTVLPMRIIERTSTAR